MNYEEKIEAIRLSVIEIEDLLGDMDNNMFKIKDGKKYLLKPRATIIDGLKKIGKYIPFEKETLDKFTYTYKRFNSASTYCLICEADI